MKYSDDTLCLRPDRKNEWILLTLKYMKASHVRMMHSSAGLVFLSLGHFIFLIASK